MFFSFSRFLSADEQVIRILYCLTFSINLFPRRQVCGLIGTGMGVFLTSHSSLCPFFPRLVWGRYGVPFSHPSVFLLHFFFRFPCMLLFLFRLFLSLCPIFSLPLSLFHVFFIVFIIRLLPLLCSLLIFSSGLPLSPSFLS